MNTYKEFITKKYRVKNESGVWQTKFKTVQRSNIWETKFKKVRVEKELKLETVKARGDLEVGTRKGNHILVAIEDGVEYWCNNTKYQKFLNFNKKPYGRI